MNDFDFAHMEIALHCKVKRKETDRIVQIELLELLHEKCCLVP